MTITYHIESTEVSSSGFGKTPDIKMSSSKDQYSRLQHILDKITVSNKV